VGGTRFILLVAVPVIPNSIDNHRRCLLRPQAAVRLCRRALYRLRGGRSLRQTAAELNTSMFNAYYELREATVHVPSLRRAVDQAKEKGVGWDPQLFCILDNVAQNHPSTWTVRL
jgi:hypothetical protein